MSRSSVAIANELCKALEDLSFECYGAFGTHSPSVDTYNKTFKILDRCRNELKTIDLPRAQSIDDEIMDLVDRLGSEYDKVDPRSWRHLLIYAPKNVDESAINDAAEKAFWQFDARRKGYSEWRNSPQSERDAFKAEAIMIGMGFYPVKE